MKLIDIVETLQAEGHRVKFRVRTDGGLIITSIDGKKFSSLTEGNKTARSMVVGGELSFARAEQVHYNVKKYIKLKEGEKKAKGSIDEELNQKLKQVQKIWRINKIEGKVSKKRLRWYIKHEGRERAKMYLEGRERYALGYANEANVLLLIERIRRWEFGHERLFRQIEALCDDIRSIINTFKEEWIEPCYQICYRKGMKIEDKIKAIREIIKVEE